MKLRRLLLLLCAFTLFAALTLSTNQVISHTAQAPAGNVNDPYTGGSITCARTGCHAGSAIADSTKFSVQMALFSAGTGALANVTSGVSTYYADSVYYMAVKANSSSTKYGFEVTVIDASSFPGKMAGSFALINNTITATSTFTPAGSTTRTYVSHRNANTTSNWTFKWTAPATGKGPLTIYYCGMDANGNGASSGDVVYKVAKVIAETSVIAGVENTADKISSLSVFPTLFSNAIQISFEMKEKALVDAQLFTLNGQMVKSLLNENLSQGYFNRSFDLEGLPSGMYLLKIQAGDNLVVRKIIRQ